MDETTFAWAAFATYVVATVLLALRGMRKTKDLAGFALGNRDMGPVLVGVTLAAALASTATFVINPGFVYAHGVSALLHFGVGSTAGIIVGIVALSKGFRRHGNRTRALTLPHWLGARYGSPAMRTYFALLNLVLAVTFVVLIIKGSALVMHHTLGLGYVTSVVVIVGFVFSYILLGGTYAHAYTNAIQGTMMIAVAVAIVLSGLHLFGDGIGAFLQQLGAQDANLVRAFNQASPLFSNAWEVFVCGFVVSFGLVCQPHILTKSLYLASDRDVNRYLLVGGIVGLVFASMLLGGLYARVMFPGIAEQDAVMPVYIAQAFPPILSALISVALLAAGMSTMDGILVSASTIVSNDLFLGALGDRLTPGKSREQREVIALKVSRWILVAMGIVGFALAVDPPELVGLFGQVGIYGLVAASVLPFTVGVFFEDVDVRHVFAAAVVGPLVHFVHYGAAVFILGETLNPAVSATEGVLASALVFGLLMAAERLARRQRSPLAARTRLERSEGR